MKRIVIIGSGVCGLVAATRLAEKLRNSRLRERASITVVSADKYHYMPAFFLDLAFGEAGPEDVRAEAKPVLEKHGVEFVHDRVVGVDLGDRRVRLAGGGELDYDYLVVCAGTRYAWEAYPGLESAHNLHTYEGALELRRVLAGFKGGNIVIAVPEFPFRCPGVVFELAAKLLVLARRRGVESKTRIMILHGLPLDRAMGRFRDVAVTVMEVLNQLGHADFAFGVKIERVEPKEKVVIASGEKVPYDLLIAMPPPRPPKPFDETDLVWKEDPRFLETSFPLFKHPKWDDVYIPTDGAMPSIHMVFAGIPVHYAAITVADSIYAEIAGEPVSEPPFPENLTFLLDLGVTGALVAFDVKSEHGGKASTKPYVAFTSPILRIVKRSFYASWITRLKE